MFAFFQRILDWFKSLFWKEEMELTLVGLQYSGKTTFVNVIAVSILLSSASWSTNYPLLNLRIQTCIGKKAVNKNSVSSKGKNCLSPSSWRVLYSNVNCYTAVFMKFNVRKKIFTFRKKIHVVFSIHQVPIYFVKTRQVWCDTELLKVSVLPLRIPLDWRHCLNISPNDQLKMSSVKP
jgi:hypothetical protein